MGISSFQTLYNCVIEFGKPGLAQMTKGVLPDAFAYPSAIATRAPSWRALIKVMLGSSTKASKKGAAPDDGLKKICPTPDAFSCATSSAPPVPCTFRDDGDPEGALADASSAAAGRNGASDCAMELAAAAVIP